MAATVCAWCKVKANMAKTGPAVQIPVPPGKDDVIDVLAFQAAFSCNNCTKLSIGSAVIRTREYGGSVDKDQWWNEREHIRWQPQTVGGKDFPGVPGHIGSAADEAHQCRSVEALRAAIVLARAVIEATCKDKGVTSGPLASKIDQMEAAGHIRGFTKDAAHELRHLGNNMAHGDFVGQVECEKLPTRILAEGSR